MSSILIDWASLEALARKLETPGINPGGLPDDEWRSLEAALTTLVSAQDWQGVIRLRQIFTAMFARDTMRATYVLKQLNEQSIAAAEELGEKETLAHFLGAEGHNLHRQGYHIQAIRVFDRAASLYRQVDKPFEALKNYYMTSLCYRAIDQRPKAREILEAVLQQTNKDEPWRGNPLQVLAWLVQDDGQLAYAEALLTEALESQRQTNDPDILMAGTLADLGEVAGLLGRTAEAEARFSESLSIIRRYEGQYDRQEARTTLKLAELLMRKRQYPEASRLLNEADDKIRAYGHYYDLMWRIEMLRAVIAFQQRKWQRGLQKMRLVRTFRREIGLTDWQLIRQFVQRVWRRTGLPR